MANIDTHLLVEYISEYLARHEVSQNKLGEMAGITSASMSLLMTGETKKPTLWTLLGLARAMGIRLTTLVGLVTDYQEEKGLSLIMQEILAACEGMSHKDKELLLRLAVVLRDFRR